jgi:death-on-curing protein
MSPVFLTLEEVLAAHQRLIDRYGGSHGLRDRAALESAVNMPKATFGGEYLHRDLFSMAAAYLFHLALNHPFVDGNKRIGTYAALAFLEINDVEVVADPDALADFVLSVAKGERTKPEIAEYLRKHSKGPVPGDS